MQQHGRILDGDLETLGLQATLKMLALSGKTGTLIVTSGQETLSLYLQKGQIAALQEQSSSSADLIEMIRLLGRMDRQVAARFRSMADQPSAVLLDAFVQYRIISEAEMLQRLEFRIIQALSRALRWQQGHFEFHRNVLSCEIPLALNVDHVLLESLRQADEWDEALETGLNRTTVARWMPEFDGDVRRLGLEKDQINVLCLANGQLTVQAIAYGLLISEAHVALAMAHLLELGLIEVVDEALEAELERNLIRVLTTSQHELSKQPQGGADQRLLVLIKALATCTNGLLNHHGQYARELRGRGAMHPRQIARYLEESFGPLLGQVQARWPIFETVAFTQGQLDCQEILALNTLVKGEQLQDFYWDVVDGLYWLMKQICTTIVRDEIGNSRSGRQFLDLWRTFLHEIDEEIARNQGRGGPGNAAQRPGGGPGGSRDDPFRESNPRMRQAESDPRVAQVRERRRM
ncbi:MAG TPA: DUF4388 domain-containing protein [Ktedonobacterales bacterium]|jgi:hypothetical protein